MHYCLECGTPGPLRRRSSVPGWIALPAAAGGIVAALMGYWAITLIGAIIVLAHLATKRTSCTACGSARIVPIDSPAAQRALADMPDASAYLRQRADDMRAQQKHQAIALAVAGAAAALLLIAITLR